MPARDAGFVRGRLVNRPLIRTFIVGERGGA